MRYSYIAREQPGVLMSFSFFTFFHIFFSPPWAKMQACYIRLLLALNISRLKIGQATSGRIRAILCQKSFTFYSSSPLSLSALSFYLFLHKSYMARGDRTEIEKRSMKYILFFRTSLKQVLRSLWCWIGKRLCQDGKQNLDWLEITLLKEKSERKAKDLDLKTLLGLETSRFPFVFSSFIFISGNFFKLCSAFISFTWRWYVIAFLHTL